MNKRKFKLFSVLLVFAAVLSVQTKGTSVQVDTSPEKMVFVGGCTVGVKIDIEGVMVVGMSYVRTPSGINSAPAKTAGLKNGDIITKTNNIPVKNISELCTAIQDCNGTLSAEVLRDGKKLTFDISPVISAEDGQYKLGAWVRDGTAGIGTITFIDPETGVYGALGHAVSDADTGNPIMVGTGELLSSSVVGIRKGAKGSPGELQGVFSADSEIGNVILNTEYGIFGTAGEGLKKGETLKTASRDEIKKGEAYIVSNIEGDKTEKYDIEITRVSRNSNNNKGLVIKITDERLLKKTGGIVQGMSGSPIIQNGKLVGAVTHVFINDPKRGYGTFIDNMINTAEEKIQLSA